MNNPLVLDIQDSLFNGINAGIDHLRCCIKVIHKNDLKDFQDFDLCVKYKDKDHYGKTTQGQAFYRTTVSRTDIDDDEKCEALLKDMEETVERNVEKFDFKEAAAAADINSAFQGQEQKN